MSFLLFSLLLYFVMEYEELIFKKTFSLSKFLILLKCFLNLYVTDLSKCSIGWNNAICSNMGGPRDYHPKRSKSERERQIPYDITYMWNLRYVRHKWTHLRNRNKLTDIENRLVAKGMGLEEGKIGSLGLAGAN